MHSVRTRMRADGSQTRFDTFGQDSNNFRTAHRQKRMSEWEQIRIESDMVCSLYDVRKKSGSCPMAT